MAEVILVFTEPVVMEGAAYDAQVCGRRAGNVWEGWIEFEDADGEAVRTARETTQPDHASLLHWARNLSMTYLEGALIRAFDPTVAAPPEVVATPQFEGPAPSVLTESVLAEDSALLDPYSVAAKGETVLRQTLGALAKRHLRNIVRAYKLADAEVNLQTLSKPELIEMIVMAVVATA